MAEEKNAPKAAEVDNSKNSGAALDPNAPIIYIRGEFNGEMAAQFRSCVRELEFIRKVDEAMINISSPGGAVFSLLEMLNTIKGSRIVFGTYCPSIACSCAAVLLSAGAKGKRFTAPMSWSMIHEMSDCAVGDMAYMRNSMKRLENINTMLMTELANNMGLSLEALLSHIKDTGTTDWWLSPTDAKQFGLVDEIAVVEPHMQATYSIKVSPMKPNS